VVSADTTLSQHAVPLNITERRAIRIVHREFIENSLTAASIAKGEEALVGVLSLTKQE
jgi:hypothetical protein